MEEAYIVIDESSSRRVAELVNHYIKQGYVPVGGISVAVAPGGWSTFVQAMIKEAK
jgi:riboflavin synthase alpha subunit